MDDTSVSLTCCPKRYVRISRQKKHSKVFLDVTSRRIARYMRRDLRRSDDRNWARCCRPSRCPEGTSDLHLSWVPRAGCRRKSTEWNPPGTGCADTSECLGIKKRGVAIVIFCLCRRHDAIEINFVEYNGERLSREYHRTRKYSN